MYFSQQESGQSTLCEDLIGLTAGEEKAEGGETTRRGDNYREETKIWEKCVSHWDFKIAPSNVDKFISDRVILDIGAFRGNCSFTGP